MTITDDYAAKLEPWSDIQGHMPFLRECASKASMAIELGTRSGNSTSALLMGLMDSGGHLWSVDVNDPDVPPAWHALPFWHFLKADGRGSEAQEWLPQETDLLFIDTDHTYEGTLEELRLYLPRVRKGGVVLMHDTEWASPAVQLDGPTGVVAQAITAYCDEHGLTWENRPGYYGMAVVRL